MTTTQRYAVSYISFFSNELISTIVTAESEKDAFLEGLHKLALQDVDKPCETAWQEDEYFQSMAEFTIEQIKEEIFNGDACGNIILIPEIATATATEDDEPYSDYDDRINLG
jgi:hypothetical protein